MHSFPQLPHQEVTPLGWSETAQRERSFLQGGQCKVAFPTGTMTCVIGEDSKTSTTVKAPLCLKSLSVTQRPLFLRDVGALLPPATMWDRDHTLLRLLQQGWHRGCWCRCGHILALMPSLCNTTIAAAVGCSFYDKISFVELSGREAESYLAQVALRESLQQAQRFQCLPTQKSAQCLQGPSLCLTLSLQLCKLR